MLQFPVQLPELPISENTQFLLGAATCFGLAGTVVLSYLNRSDNGLPLPPSPPNWRIRGHYVPYRKSYLTVAQWIDKYGPMVTIRQGTEKIVIIGRQQAVVDIMEKQGAASADRPPMVSAGEMLSGGQSIAFTHVGDRLRLMRRALHSHLQPRASEAYEPLQMSTVKDAILDILDDPHSFQNHALTFTSSTIMKVAYGKTTRTFATDPELKDVRRRFQELSKSLRPGAYLVDTVPWLKHLPFYGRELRRDFERGKKLYTDQLAVVKEQLRRDEDTDPSFAKFMLENDRYKSWGFSEIEVAWLAGGLLLAGSHSAAVAICTVIMTAALHPEEQAKVQAELDEVIGRNRAPTFSDETSLPRLRAFIAECYRWRPTAPEGIAHRTTHDVIWENYCIPAGTTVIGNHWAISRDPDVYPDPYAFKPERWLDDAGEMREDLKFYVFGFGRRVCPGQHFAPREVFIHSLLALWAFRIELDDTKPINDMGYMSGVVPDLQPCTVEFKARIPEKDIRRMMETYPEPPETL
ncbi:cytochrome P450 [Rhizopogon vinicolor AM-OR11-026]|uniref:Cytochrome P450 n=1 Tax=Rhizopogon vinicolor AM-OR11-026 TaxID=1314800 RepID=A0A1B7MKJ8_9AGAM|nr:cytochrome P450 [Rhizopogon vinicolor AM-OR11-026]